jgi:heme exporter protein C
LNLPSITEFFLTPGQVFGIAAILAIVVRNLSTGRVAWHLPQWEHAFGLVGLSVLIDGQYMGLVDAPAERMMGEVGRILYVHVPSAWLTMVCFLFSCIFAGIYLASGRKWADLLVEATAEVGVVMCGLLLVTGSIFARPTWGTWWTWDPRLTSSAVMMIAYVGVLLLRASLQDPKERALWTSVASLLAAVSMALTYFSVRLWRSIHQMQSSPSTIDDDMVMILRMNAFAMLFIGTWFVARRARIGIAQAAAQAPPPLPPEMSNPFDSHESRTRTPPLPPEVTS